MRFDETLAPGAAPERIHCEPFGTRIHADGSPWTGTWLESRIGFAGVEHDDLGLVNMGGRIYDPAQRRFLTPDPMVSDPSLDQAWHRYSYARNNHNGVDVWLQQNGDQAIYVSLPARSSCRWDAS